MLDENLDKKLRIVQAKQIHKTKKSDSFPQVLNMVLEEGY